MATKRFNQFPSTGTLLSSDKIPIDQGGIEKYITAESLLEQISDGSPFKRNIIPVSGTTRTLGISDVFGYLRCTNASPTTITVAPFANAPWEIGDTIKVYNAAGTVEFLEGSGVTINFPPVGNTLVDVGEEATLTYIGSDEWDMYFSGISVDTVVSVTSYAGLLALTPGDWALNDVVQVTGDDIAGLFKVVTGSAADNGGTIKTNSTWNTASKHWERVYSGTINVRWFGVTGDGSTDDTSAIQDAIDAANDGDTLYFPPGDYKVTSQLLVSGREGITFKGDRYAKLLFTDGSYIGLLFDNYSYNCSLETLQLYGDDNTSPAITLVKSTGDSAYFRVKDCEFAYASICILLAKTYVVKLLGNTYSNSDTYVKGTSAEGPTADLLMQGETFATTTIGSNAAVDIKFLQSRINNCYFELQGHGKKSVYVQTGSQKFMMVGNAIENSGEIHVEGSVTASFTGNNLIDAHCGSRSFKFDGGAVVSVTGGEVRFASFATGITGISSSAVTTIMGVYVDKADIGIAMAGTSGAISGNTVSGCTTGIKLLSGSAGTCVMGNTCSGNTTDIDNANGGPNIITFNYATTISDAANNGTLYGNYPYRGILRSTVRGNTAGRPTLSATSYGHMYMDTTLDSDGKPIWWTGTVWVDATGAVV